MARIININHKDSEDFEYQIQTIRPGEFSCPYHFHHTSEEIFIVLEGNLTLRSPDGFRVLKEGDIVFFEKGSSGAHQLYNNTNQNSIYLDLASKKGTDVCEYLDNGKIGIYSKYGFDLFKRGSEATYYQGENYESTRSNWKKHGFKF